MIDFSEYKFIPESLANLLDSGGPVVLILLLLSVFVVTLLVYKFISFLFSGLIVGRSPDPIIKLWISGQRDEAYRLSLRSRQPTGRVLAHLMRGLQKDGAEEVLVREDIERVASNKLSGIRSYFKAIEAVVQIAPLLGLFGTVIGMIEAFQKLQNAGSDVDPAILAGGIWVALLTTAVGLAVAIPSAFALYWFEALAQREQERMESSITSVLTGRITEDGTTLRTNGFSSEKIKSINDAA